MSCQNQNENPEERIGGKRPDDSGPRVNPEMLGLARDYVGFTQAGLAARLSFTQTTLSRYEAGIVDIPHDHLVEIAQVLDRPLSFFYRDDRIYATSAFYHRKRSKLSAKDGKRIGAQVNDLRIQANMLLFEAQIESAYRFHHLGSVVCGSPEHSARQLRQLWQLPPGPIRNVVSSIESAGGIVFPCQFGTDKLDGISQWTLDNPNAPPVFFVNEEMPADRQRFTLSHEIGHVVMH
jgi:transcriptional regulator with XRE-family HTH domain